MKIIINKASNKVVASGCYISLSESGAVLPDCRAPNITTATHKLIEVDNLPSDYQDNHYTYTDQGGWQRAQLGIDALVDKNISKAKEHREEIKVSPIRVFNVEWDIDNVSRDNMRSAIETADRNNLPPEKTQGWILADDTIRQTTASELGQVLDAYAYRLSDVFTQYSMWLAGNKTDAFQYNPN